jgi:signal transduction histidine kinase/ActR/RegA family two-component response regulator
VEEPGKPGQPPPRLAELAQLFRAHRAGWAGFWQDTPAVQHRIAADGQSAGTGSWPWEDVPNLIAAVRAAPRALSVRSAGTSYLLAAFTDRRGDRSTDAGNSASGPGKTAPEGGTWLLWLENEGPRNWTREEEAALTLALLACIRRIDPQGDFWSRWADVHYRQQQMEAAAPVVGRLIHDFNNILTGVMGFTELSLGQLTPGSAPHQFVSGVYQAAQQGSNLINQLSQFSRRNKPRPAATPLAVIVQEEHTRLCKLSGAAQPFQVQLPERLPSLAVEPEALRQILGRLLDNAREATERGGAITVSARLMELTTADCLDVLGKIAPGLYVQVTVSDTGAGFTLEARQRVFAEPFYSSKPRHRGLGLGSVYGALCCSGGGIQLEHGTAPATAVHVYLPPVLAEIEPTVVPAAVGKTAGEKLLIVDDDPLTLQLMCTTLERAGYRVQSAADGAAALESFSQAGEPFRLLLSDVVMPRMTGFDLAQRLLDRDPRLHVLFTSGYIPPGFVPEAFASRHFDLLAKPFRPEGLLRAVRAALDREMSSQPAGVPPVPCP